MTVKTARPRCLKRKGTFKTLHTMWTLVSSQALVTAPLRHQEERITLDITRQSILYTDARPGDDATTQWWFREK